jgi:predicted nucleic acid-binding protein
MVTWLGLLVGVPFGLWLIGEVLNTMVERRVRAARERERRMAQAILEEWTRLGQAVDLDPAAVVREAERIIGRQSRRMD